MSSNDPVAGSDEPTAGNNDPAASSSDRFGPAPPLPAHVSTPGAFFSWFHSVVPSATSAVFGRGRVADGQSSYNLALSAWGRDGAPGAVLDVGCGDGYLLSVARGRWPKARLVGVDIAPHEAEVALAEMQVAVRRSEAAELPLGRGEVDLALFHLTLPFLPDPVGALRAARDVLRPGGALSAVLATRPSTYSVYQRFGDEVRRLYAEGHYRPMPLFNGATGSVEALRELFAAAGMTDVQIEDHELVLDGSRQEVWRCLATTYDWPLLDEGGREELLRLSTQWLDAAEPIVCRFGLRHVVARIAEGQV